MPSFCSTWKVCCVLVQRVYEPHGSEGCDRAITVWIRGYIALLSFIHFLSSSRCIRGLATKALTHSYQTHTHSLTHGSVVLSYPLWQLYSSGTISIPCSTLLRHCRAPAPPSRSIKWQIDRSGYDGGVWLRLPSSGLFQLESEWMWRRCRTLCSQ